LNRKERSIGEYIDINVRAHLGRMLLDQCHVDLKILGGWTGPKEGKKITRRQRARIHP